MAYTDIWTHANDEAFQGRCWAALWDVANKIINNEVGYPAAGQEGVGEEDDRYALSILRDSQRIVGKQLAQQVLRNTTIAANPATSTDGDILFQINSIWSELRLIG